MEGFFIEHANTRERESKINMSGKSKSPRHGGGDLETVLRGHYGLSDWFYNVPKSPSPFLQRHVERPSIEINTSKSLLFQMYMIL